MFARLILATVVAANSASLALAQRFAAPPGYGPVYELEGLQSQLYFEARVFADAARFELGHYDDYDDFRDELSDLYEDLADYREALREARFNHRKWDRLDDRAEDVREAVEELGEELDDLRRDQRRDNNRFRHRVYTHGHVRLHHPAPRIRGHARVLRGQGPRLVSPRQGLGPVEAESIPPTAEVLPAPGVRRRPIEVQPLESRLAVMAALARELELLSQD